MRLREQHEASEEEEEGNDVEEEEEEEEEDKKASGSFSRQNSTEFPGGAAARGATVSGGELGAAVAREGSAAEAVVVGAVAAGDAGQKVKVELPVWQAMVWEQDVCVCVCQRM